MGSQAMADGPTTTNWHVVTRIDGVTVSMPYASRLAADAEAAEVHRQYGTYVAIERVQHTTVRTLKAKER